MKTVRLTTCENAIQAHLLQGALENEGIKSILHNENFSTLLPGYANIMGAGVQVLVMENDLEESLQVLSRNIPQEKKYCPFCGSEKISTSLGKLKISKIFFSLLSALGGTPLGNIRTVYKCGNCQKEFDVPEESPLTSQQEEVQPNNLQNQKL
ncbi:DUF2007 domain-containing protein [uncultured Bacteroides sp.]|uniref:putative signal transducing protein n=1 Tax=uncultured Bacteroides sp. TaxID=162156 RepID=UPI002AAAB720|nr:DUF2007 domain-containing protein [uncultured Bacteroides sp.]